MNRNILKVGNTIYRVWTDKEGPRGEAYIIEAKLSDYLVQVRDRNGKVFTLSYLKDNIIIYKSNAIKIYETLQKEWDYFHNNKHVSSYSQDVFLENIKAGDSVVILNESNNKTWEIKIVKSQLSYTPQLGSGFLKNSFKYKTEIKEFSNINENEAIVFVTIP